MPPPSPSPEYKHFCRVCNKGFTCGSALGGHMRAHGSSDEMHGVVLDDDDDESLGDEPARGRGSSDNHQRDAAGPSSSAATHAYALRANPNRLVRSCQVCKNCGREFTSWDLFLEHGRCISDDEGGRADADDGSLRPSLSPPSDAEDDGEEDPAVAAAWSKGKRSRRVKLLTAVDEASAEPSRRCASGEEEDLANCLVMLSSSSNIEHAGTVVAGTSQQEPCAPASKERDREPQLLQPISFLAPAPEPVMALPSAAATMQYASPAPRGMFECKACKKVFTSHQALGGHRASHKKVKGCFAARFESNVVSETATSSHAATTADPTNDNGKGAAAEPSTTHAAADAKTSIYAGTDGDLNVGTSETAAALSMALVGPVVHEPPVAAAFNVAAAAAAPSKKNATKMHECSVCHRLFTSGQALGGHKRCHWLTTSSTADSTNPVANLTVPPLTEDIVGAVRHQLMLRPMMADAPEPALDLTIAAKPLPLTTAPPLVVQAEPGGSSSSSFHHLDASPPAQLHLQSPVVIPGNASHRNKTSTASGHAEGDDAAAGSTAAEDEGENSTVIKRARFTDLKDVVRMDGEATEPWLQVGIGSSSAGGDGKSARG